MTRSELLRKIIKEARRLDIKITKSERTNHTLFTIGKSIFWMPRHEKMKYGTERKILQDLEQEFGKGWYR
jgi:hypothetical protein